MSLLTHVDWVAIIFWSCTACVVYTCALYPLILGLLAWMWNRPLRPHGPAPTSVSIILAAHNEAARISARLEELIGLLDRSGLSGEIIVVVNGSTDETAELVNAYSSDNVRVLEFHQAVGKAAALSAGASAAQSEILVFGDVRQRWAEDVLPRLVDHFRDQEIGAVSGDLMVESAPGVLAGVALYWHFEKWLRVRESRVWSMVGATGAISAVRRSLFRPIPTGTILDDVYWPLQVARQGFRVYHDTEIHAYDQLPPRTRDEFRRKVRTLSGNFQLAARLPGALLPWRNPIWWQLVSHKLLRLVVPWALLGMLFTSALSSGPFFTTLLMVQLVCYTIGVAGMWPAIGKRWRLAGAAASFLVLNSAAWIAFWVWLTGREGRTWGKVAYQPAEGSPRPVCRLHTSLKV
jgi:cellulose synthase/poly-beta-1,6-N-acetylglucosamine synthase-like glycosyltransferase